MYHSPKDPSSNADCRAAQRGNEFELGWFADPLYFGDYPEVNQPPAQIRDRQLPRVDARLPKNIMDQSSDHQSSDGACPHR